MTDFDPIFPQDWYQTLSDGLRINDAFSWHFIHKELGLNETLTLNDVLNVAKNLIIPSTFKDTIYLNDVFTAHITVKNLILPKETIRLTDTFADRFIFKNLILKTGNKISFSDSLNARKWMQYTQNCSETLNLESSELASSYGVSGNNSVYVFDTSANEWIEVEGIEYFKVEKRLNQMSKFLITMPQIENAQKLYIKEFAKVMLFSGTTLILKGRIQKVTYETAYSATIEGFGMEAVILDKEYKNATRSPNDEDRVQYDNVSAQTIANELLSTNADGIAPWTMTPISSGIFSSDYGLISMRYEYANKLTALGNLANAISYDWWVSHTDTTYADDYFNLATIKGNQTDPSGDSNRQFTITGAAVNAEGTDYQKDVTNVANYVKIIGYGDGINQLFTSTYNASPIWTTLYEDISDSATTIHIIDGSGFAVSGTIRIAEEIITYTGRTVNNLTGCTRGTSGTTALAHRSGCYLEKYVASTSPEANSSISENGLMELTLTSRDIRDLSTLELIASKELIDRMDPIERITITPSDPDAVAETLETGDLVSIVDAESSLNSNYRIVAIIYENNYGMLSMALEASNKSLTFIEQMQKEREKNQALQKYMQGSTNVYVVNNVENCDNGYGCILKTYIPADTIAINHILLSYDVSAYRIYNTTTANESSHTHGIDAMNVDIPSLTVNSTSTSANTTVSTTPSSTSAVSVWSSYTADIPYSALVYVEENIVHDGDLYTTRAECLVQNVTGGTVTIDARVTYPSGSTDSQGHVSLPNNSVQSFLTGQTSSSNDAGWAYFQDYHDVASRVSGIIENVYTHTHGSHNHTIPSLTVSGTSTQSTTTTTPSDATIAGSAHNHGVSYRISTGSNTITDMQIYIDGVDRTGLIETQIGHTLSTNSTESDIDITQWIDTVGAWHTIDIRPNGTCRISGDMYNQVFIESV